MYINLDQVLVEVSQKKILLIEKAAGMTFYCVSGNLWITKKNCIQDFELTPGDSYIADSPQSLTVCGFEHSVVRIFQPSKEREISSYISVAIRNIYQFCTRSVANLGSGNRHG